MTKRKIAAFLLSIFLLSLLLNIKVTTKQGINYNVTMYRIPLYIKIIEFIDRDYRYRMLVREIISQKMSDEEKVLAILSWVHSNIKTDIPADWPIYDDHILNVIIRGYGAPDQLNDVFTTLCAYAGLPAGWTRIEIPGQKGKLVVSFVNVGGTWRVFDAYRNTYFVNEKGEIASLADIINHKYERSQALKVVDQSSVTYEDYFENMDLDMHDIDMRPRKQMPIQRIAAELRNFQRALTQKNK